MNPAMRTGPPTSLRRPIDRSSRVWFQGFEEVAMESLERTTRRVAIRTGTPMSEATLAANGAPTVVLVHGAWPDGSGWAGVIAPLHRAGEAVVAPANPLRDISGTLGELQRVLGAIAEGLREPAPPADLLATPEVAVLPARAESGSLAQTRLLAGGLSGREVEVLQLVAEGLTNAQIAERLFVSPKTVGSHLVSIFGKLGVTSRAAATRCAIEQGLV
jgi:DNA-binding CsgD family transcriptional regulator